MAYLSISNPSTNVDFIWSFSPNTSFTTSSTGLDVAVDMSNNSSVSYCLVTINYDTGIITSQFGFLNLSKNCNDDIQKFKVIPNPINIRADRSITIKLNDDNIKDEVVNNGTKLEFFIIRSIDSRKVKQFFVSAEETMIDVSDLERGAYTIFTNSSGKPYNENFIVVDDF